MLGQSGAISAAPTAATNQELSRVFEEYRSWGQKAETFRCFLRRLCACVPSARLQKPGGVKAPQLHMRHHAAWIVFEIARPS